MSEKIQKILANQGLGSRREIEKWLSAGRLRVNEQTVQLGDRANLADRFYLDGQRLHFTKAEHDKPRVLMYRKSIGELCTRHDPQGRNTVFSRLPTINDGRWIMVGRLDINTGGLLLFTNDGELAHRLMHPKYQVEREYAVRVLGQVTDDMLSRLRTGVQLEDGLAKFDNISQQGGEGSNTWYRVLLREGRNRLVRRLWQSQGISVSRLIRVRYANIILPRQLRVNKYQEIIGDTLKQLYTLSRKS